MSYFIDVILPIPLKKLFTYQVNQSEASFLKPGMRVAVPFGKSKIYSAIVASIHTNAPTIYEAKEIHQILDESPIVNNVQLKHWKWIANYYMCSIGEVFRAAVPSSFLLESETIVMKNENVVVNELDLKDDEWLVYEALQHQAVLRIHELMEIVNRKNVFPILKRLLEEEIISLKEELYEQYKPKLVRYVKLNDQYVSEASLQQLLDSLSRAPKQRKVLLTLFSLSASSKNKVKTKELEIKSEVSPAVIKALITKKIP